MIRLEWCPVEGVCQEGTWLPCWVTAQHIDERAVGRVAMLGVPGVLDEVRRLRLKKCLSPPPRTGRSRFNRQAHISA